MPKYYLEIAEKTVPDDIFQGHTIIMRVKDKTQAINILSKIKTAFPEFFNKLKYIASYHICNHDTGQSCVREKLEEV